MNPRLRLERLVLQRFLEYAKTRYNPRTVRCFESYLERYALGVEFSSPLDVAKCFEGLSPGQAHQLNRALRAFLNFCVLDGYPEDFVRMLKRGIPRDHNFIDLRIPGEDEIVFSLRRAGSFSPKYEVLFNLLLDSGLRLVEAVNLLVSFDPQRLMDIGGGVYRYPLAMLRGPKNAYYAYLTDYTLTLIRGAPDMRIDYLSAQGYFEKYSPVKPKYIRKFVYSKMIELGVPESIADYIQGRSPTRIGAIHYMSLTQQADHHYKRYAEYLRALRAKASI